MARKSSFDRDDKLRDAMELFWQKGYANTAVSDLVEKLKINRFSLYNTYGDKQQLYYQALDKYLHSVSLPNFSALMQPDASLEQIEAFLRHFTELQIENCHGCFMQNAVVEHAGEDDKVLEMSYDLFDTVLAALTRAISRAQQQHKIRRDLKPELLSSLILTQMQGIRVLSKAKRYEDLHAACAALLTLIKEK